MPKQNKSPFSEEQLKQFTYSSLKLLTPYEVVEKHVKTFNTGEDPKRFYAALIELTKKPEYRILREKNTMLLILNQKNGVAEGLFFVADGEQEFPESLTNILKALKVGKFTTLILVVPSPNLARIIQQIGYKADVQQAQNLFKITVTL